MSEFGRIRERYPSLNKYFEYKIIADTENLEKATDLKYKKLPVFDIDGEENPLVGSYVIESSFPE
ncbi:MAG: hypothetical protein U9O87_10295 [Verrucomicrobiota bacterium]|nr:hypothetical protein [Verrucomicrobiota bacterium]